MNTPPQWRFRQMQPGEMNIDPIEAEFFSTEALGSLSDALVREAIQNSLDARRGSETLTMRIYFPTADKYLQGERRAGYLRGLFPHLQGSRSGLSAQTLPSAEEPLSFLVLEDFGTRGLQGDPAQSEDDELEPNGAGRNDFFFFWRNVGRSRKHAADLGRWGLGKTVFPAASRINSFMALTLRANDKRSLLLGQSVLKIHKLDHRRYYPYGYFGDFDGDFASPLESSELLANFTRDFGLARGYSPGLSVVLPYPDPDLTPQTVIDSVLRHYFMPILAGDLVVKLEHPSGTETLDAQTTPELFTATSGAQAASLKSTFDLARWSIAVPQSEYVRLAAPDESAAPRWNDGGIEEKDVRKLRERFDAGKPIAMTAPVWVKPMDGKHQLSEFDLYLQRDDSLERSDEHFVRDGITVTGVRAGLPRGIRLIVAIRDRVLSALVGDSENPAHTEWQERSLKFKDRYHHGPFTLRYLKNVPREIVRLLTRPSEDRDFALLKQLFAIDIPTEAELKDQLGDLDTPGSGEETEADVTTVGKGKSFTLQKLRGGFRVKGIPSPGGPPRQAAVWVAYEVRRGNPFRHYQPLDFDLSQSPIEVNTRNAKVADCRRNGLLISPERADFQLTVRGFDPHRDIRVRVLAAGETPS